MTQHTVVEYEANIAEKSASEDYISSDISVSESQALTAPLSDARVRATDRKQNIAVSVRFANPGETCDVMLVTWMRKKPASGVGTPGTYVPLGFFKESIIADASATDDAGNPIAQTVLFDTDGVRSYEVRIVNLVGSTVKRVKTWTF